VTHKRTVTPAKAEGQEAFKSLDSGFRLNEEHRIFGFLIVWSCIECLVVKDR
jgi:hypothetical protein